MSACAMRLATAGDAETINDIQNHYVVHSTATFLTEPLTLAQRTAWLHGRSPAHPVTFAEIDGVVAGWGALGEFRSRPAYRYSTEFSVYASGAAPARVAAIAAYLVFNRFSQAETPPAVTPAVTSANVVAAVSPSPTQTATDIPTQTPSPSPTISDTATFTPTHTDTPTAAPTYTTLSGIVVNDLGAYFYGLRNGLSQ